MRTLPAWQILVPLLLDFGEHFLNIHTMGKFTFGLPSVQPQSKS
jgi:hypothetical protein